MNEQGIDEIINKLKTVSPVLAASSSEIIAVGDRLIIELLASSKAKSEDLLKYTIEQIIMHASYLAPSMMKQISATYPEYKGHAEKLLVLL